MPLNLAHMNIYGPTRTNSLRGERYFIVFTNDFTMFSWILLLKDKLAALSKLKIFKAHVENEKEIKMKCFIYERGGEFISEEFESFYAKHSINRQYSVVRTPK